MTKKNAKKVAARARQDQHDGKYQRHLRTVGGADGREPASAFFEAIAGTIREKFAAARVTLDLVNSRICVRTDKREVFVCTVNDEPPKWPAYVLLPVTPDGDRPSWECTNIEDVLTVLRWPDATPSHHYASPNEIRDTLENEARHVWERIPGAPHPFPEPLVITVACQNCKTRLHLNNGETITNVERIAFANWRRRETGQRHPRLKP